MSKKCTAFKYSRDFSFLNVFGEIGDAVNVFVPAELITLDCQPISESIVFGSCPYSVQSDIIAIIAHMGILYPSEKQKKSSPNYLYTCPNALKLKTSDQAISHEESCRIDDDFRFYGVVVTVLAYLPLDIYPGTVRFNISSQTSTDTGPFSLDIVDYHFISEYEPMPVLIDNPLEIKLHFNDFDERFYHEDENIDFVYSPSLFTPSATAVLFRDFIVSFLVGDDRILFKSDQPNKLSIYKFEETETLIQDDVPFDSISFENNSITVNDKQFSPVFKVFLIKKE